MGEFSHGKPAREKAGLEWFAANSMTALPSTKGPQKAPETGDPPPLISTNWAPTTSEMLHPRNAWRRLCAATGCEICMGSFYRWIRTGRLYTVRLGGKVFVPVSALETLIEHCLRGESL